MLEARGIGGWRNGLLELSLEVGNGGGASFSAFEQKREREGVKWSWGCALGEGNLHACSE